jgi:hypothetical protein
MKISQLIALFVALLCAFTAEGFAGYKSRISHRRVSLDGTSQSDSNPAEVVEVKVIVSGKNVQGPWYRTTVRHEVKERPQRPTSPLLKHSDEFLKMFDI